jgi:hypothetical protein
VDGRRDLVARSSSEVSDKISGGPELLGDEDVELFDVFEDSLEASWDRGGEVSLGAGEGVRTVANSDRNGEGGVIFCAAPQGDDTGAGEPDTWKNEDLVGEIGERGWCSGCDNGGTEYWRVVCGQTSLAVENDEKLDELDIAGRWVPLEDVVGTILTVLEEKKNISESSIDWFSL